MLSPVPGYSPCLACALVHLLFYFMVVGKPTRGAFLPPTGLECEELLFEQCRPVGKIIITSIYKSKKEHNKNNFSFSEDP